MGRNFDWDRDPVLVLLARPAHGHASIALVDIRYLGYSAASPSEEGPARLENAPALPFDGVNDAGLAAGMMAVPHAEGLGDGGRPVVDELGFIRLVLDRAGTVDEAMALAASHNVRFTSVPLHYFVADRSGDSAVIEFSGGKALFFHGKDGWQVSTNFLFADVPEDRRVAECWRYALATRELAASKGQAAPLIMLSELSQPSTLWSSVYDLGEGSLELALGRRWEETLTWQLGR
jgi:choloylglycine hydrolase